MKYILPAILLYSYVVKAQSISQDSLFFKQASWQIVEIGERVYWHHYHFNEKNLFSANQNIHFIKFKNGKRHLKIEFASGGDSLIKTSILAKREEAIAAINGSFFDVKNGGAVDLIKINGRIFDTTRYTRNRLAEHQRAAVSIKRKKLKIIAGDSLNLKWAEHLKYKNIMVTGPLLMLNAKPYPLSKTPFNENRHPRSCVCLTNENDVIFLTADGRTSEAQGLNLPELTHIMRWLNCRDAINLDGGGSTTLYIANQPHSGVANMPCDNKKFDHEGERAVSNIILIKKSK